MTDILDHDILSFDDLLSHHGIKGMKWGVRKEDESSSQSTPTKQSNSSNGLSQHQKEIAKKVAIGAGILAVIAGGAYVGYKLNQSGSLPISDFNRSVDLHKGEALTKKILKEPTEIIHSTRGHSKGFTFVKKGGLDDPLSVYEKAFGRDSGATDIFKRVDDKIAASFLDPDGRKDFAGRPIPHQIIIPRSMTNGISNLDDVKTKIWPLLKDNYSEFYDATKPK